MAKLIVLNEVKQLPPEFEYWGYSAPSQAIADAAYRKRFQREPSIVYETRKRFFYPIKRNPRHASAI